MKLKAGEVVWFSWIVYKSRKHRDQVNAKVMKDPRLAGMGAQYVAVLHLLRSVRAKPAGMRQILLENQGRSSSLP